MTDNTNIVPLEDQREDSRIVNEVDYFYYNESPVDPPIVDDDEGWGLFYYVSFSLANRLTNQSKVKPQ